MAVMVEGFQTVAVFPPDEVAYKAVKKCSMRPPIIALPKLKGLYQVVCGASAKIICYVY
ncbi:uncharacterized protein PHALS_10721 [Plasmopara halstedii]|uniref:Uncharacterized protein n=1 Tax=Plasmopara halstedii TaxID=4781 RepID=A0A0P1AH89_PLAHL|nr:uncharacterized protein PHALS_10721 [Plasmopara halstedii]CEG40527.1 hypothetical protein PHALS_10721 [Plasmopara halstedii]|eukprot:XP_024576896.1 hypothetical protein PHALS_10721 [Plasmopara halstedii]